MKTIYKKKFSNKDIKRIINKPFGICTNDNTFYMIEKKGNELEIINGYLLDSLPNAVASNGDEIAIGCLNGDVLYKNGNSEFNVIYKHTNNVCSIDIRNGMIFSGSWDHDAILYNIEKDEYQNTKKCGNVEADAIPNKHKTDDAEIKKCIKDASLTVIYGADSAESNNAKKRHLSHPGSVWCAKIVSCEELMTGCADGIIRTYQNGKKTAETAYHNGPVRGIVLENDVMFTIDNNGGVFKINKSGVLIRSRFVDEQLYCICLYKDYVVVGGEQGKLFLLNRDLEIISKKKLQTHAVWDMCENMGSLFAACGEGIVYELNEESEELVEEEKEKEVEDTEFESGGVRYKIIKGEVFYETQKGWEVIGNTINKYDHSFTINLDDKNYTLSFNNKDNVYEIARNFLFKNKLRNEYQSEIVDYINKNFKKNSLFKKYENIDLEGIERKVGKHKITLYIDQILKNEHFSDLLSVQPNIYEIEHVLFAGFYENADMSVDSLPLFIVLDISRFLISKGYVIDMSFIFRISISDVKEARTFANLMTNLLTKLPFNFTALDKKIMKLKDSGLITLYNLENYMENKRLIKK